MLISNLVLFDGYVAGTGNVYSRWEDNDELGRVDALTIGGYTAQATGTNPTITVQVEQSFDDVRWLNRNSTAEVSAATLSTSAETPFGGADGSRLTRPTLAYARIRITLGGTGSVGAYVRVWASGHDRGG
jgi:hypothetical protein